MHRIRYRVTVLACALAWFLVGLHLPALHAITHHGARPSWGAVALVVALAAAALVALGALLRHASWEETTPPHRT